LVGGFKSWG